MNGKKARNPYERDRDGWIEFSRDFLDNAKHEIARAVIEAELEALEREVTRKDGKGRPAATAGYYSFAVYSAGAHAALSLDIDWDAPFPMLRGCFIDELDHSATQEQLSRNPLAHIDRDGFHESYDFGDAAAPLLEWDWDSGYLSPLSGALMSSSAMDKMADALAGHMYDVLFMDEVWRSPAFDRANKGRELEDPDGWNNYYLSINAKQVYVLGGDLRVWDSPREAAGENDLYAWVGTPISAEGMERICDAMPGRSGANPGDGSPTVDYLDIDLSSPFADAYGAQAITSLDMEPGLMEGWNRSANRWELDDQRIEEEIYGVPSVDPALEELEDQGLI